jgi:hypothetical protein
LFSNTYRFIILLITQKITHFFGFRPYFFGLGLALGLVKTNFPTVLCELAVGGALQTKAPKRCIRLD